MADSSPLKQNVIISFFSNSICCPSYYASYDVSEVTYKEVPWVGGCVSWSVFPSRSASFILSHLVEGEIPKVAPPPQ